MNSYVQSKNLRQTVYYLMMVTFMAYYAGITLFVHSHLVRGLIITHSHPYNIFDPSARQHDHTAKEYQMLDVFMHLQAVLPPSFVAFYMLLGLVTILCCRVATMSGFGVSTFRLFQRPPPMIVDVA